MRGGTLIHQESHRDPSCVRAIAQVVDEIYLTRDMAETGAFDPDIDARSQVRSSQLTISSAAMSRFATRPAT